MMAALTRKRQGDFELGKNVFEYEELEKGEASWAPQLRSMLDKWQDNAKARGKSEPMTKSQSSQNSRPDRQPERRRRNSSSEPDASP